jgi:hypothetical protein
MNKNTPILLIDYFKKFISERESKKNPLFIQSGIFFDNY